MCIWWSRVLCSTRRATLYSPKYRERSFWDRCYDFCNIFTKKFGEKLAFLTQNEAKLWKNLIITLVFEKNANFLAGNWQKSQKIVIITSVLDPRRKKIKWNEISAKTEISAPKPRHSWSIILAVAALVATFVKLWRVRVRKPFLTWEKS
jgi:hypothetical protein